MVSLGSAPGKPAAAIRPLALLRLDRWTLLSVGLAFLVALPVLVVLSSLLIPATDIWYHLATTVLPRYLANTAILMIGVGIGCTVIGVSCAWLVTMCQFPGARLFEWAVLLPLAIPAYVIAYTYTGLLDYAGPIQSQLRALGWLANNSRLPELRSVGGAVVMLTLVLYPYVYLLARAAFLEQSVCVLEVGRTLGRTPWHCFTSIALPLARPGIIAGLALALMETLNDFGTVQYFAVDTFTTGIYRTWLGLGDVLAATQLAAVLLLFVILLIWLEKRSRGQARFHHTTARYRPLPRYQLHRARALAALVICGLPVVLGFVLPVIALAGWSLESAAAGIDERFISYARNSLLLAGIAAVLAVTLAVLIGYAKRFHGGGQVMRALRIATLGYAVPGTVIAVGTLLPLSWIDQLLNSATHWLFDRGIGLLLSGTVFALIYAYLVRFLAVAANAVDASLAKVTLSMDHAARSLGRTPWQTLRDVHAPIIRPSMISAGLLVFVDVMKELPATLILRPFNMSTLAVEVHHLASDERLIEAAPGALVIVLVGIVPVILMSRLIARSRPGVRQQERA